MKEENGFILVYAAIFMTVFLLIAIISSVLSQGSGRLLNLAESDRLSFYAAEAGGEEALAWLSQRTNFPSWDENGVVHEDEGSVISGEEYEYRIQYLYHGEPKEGFDPERFRLFYYAIEATGRSREGAEARIRMVVGRIFDLDT